jgi:hypothetical protein
LQLNASQLDEDEQDSITWNFTWNGDYTTTSAYHAQFLGARLTNMNKMVWKVWTPTKRKFFAWLAIRNRIWMAYRLERRGLDNYGFCPLCKQTQGMAKHIFSRCSYTKMLWDMVKCWPGIPSVRTHEWAVHTSLREWWKLMLCNAMENRKAMSSITMLATLMIWKERNARFFNNRLAPPIILL